MKTTKEIANEILNQLGGNQFIAMTGSKNFGFYEGTPALSMHLTKNKLKAKYLTITLNSMDTYDVEFSTVNKSLEKTILNKTEGVYCDQLRGLFERLTGLRTSLTAIYA